MYQREKCIHRGNDNTSSSSGFGTSKWQRKYQRSSEGSKEEEEFLLYLDTVGVEHRNVGGCGGTSKAPAAGQIILLLLELPVEFGVARM